MNHGLSPLIVALDVNTEDELIKIASTLGQETVMFKIGLELYTALGTGAVDALRKYGKMIFLDLKIHDIPNTMAKAVTNCCDEIIAFTDIHATAGKEGIRASADALRDANERLGCETKLLAVTLLTSLDQADLETIGLKGDRTAQVLSLAALARENGADGIVCSPHEAPAVRKALGKEFLVITPGIRANGSKHDQKMTATPRGAIEAGADHIVVGRMITEALDPAAAARSILRELGV